MSWGTCYSAPNNIHFDFPAVMNDGRTFTTHLSPYEMNESIKQKENIKTNKDYKNYLVKNGLLLNTIHITLLIIIAFLHKK